MVLNTTQPTHPSTPTFSDTNKENVVLKSSSVLRNANGRRPRSRTNNTPSPVIIAREVIRDPGRRRTQSPPTRTHRLVGEDVDVEMAEPATTTAAAPSASERRIRLPRHLHRPEFKDIDPDALEAIDPDLKEVALEYILEKLEMVGQQMLAVAASTTAQPPRDRLPRELEVVINDLSADVPTHLFAVYSKPAMRVSIHPAHALILGVHCAHLPILPPSHPASPSELGTRLTLPVVPLCIPNPSTFPILLHYLYTKRGDHLLASLLPMAPRDATQSVEQLAQSFSATFTVQALLSHAARVHGLWSNLAALGVFDEKLWRGVEMVWEVLLNALKISTGSSWQSEQQA